jgi:hypothetical protein
VPSKKNTPARKTASPDSSAAVDAFMASLEHPHKSKIEALRRIIRAADPSIAEGVKWNAPSYRTTEYFATTHLRAKDGVGLIFHLGAKVHDATSVRVDDPGKMLQWLGTARAMVTFSSMDEIRARKASLERIVRQWIKHV